MSAPGSCPRCGGDLRPPGLWSSAWQCDVHGPVAPLHLAPAPSEAALAHVLAQTKVPLWAPFPPPVGWLVSGLGWAGDDRTGGRASVLALSGPSPVGGPADWLLVAEEPGVGLGARYAGLSSTDPGEVAQGVPATKLVVAGHPTALWNYPDARDRAVFVGEAKGLWLYAILWPPEAGLLLEMEDLVIRDLREAPGADAYLPYGAPTPRLTDPPG